MRNRFVLVVAVVGWMGCASDAPEPSNQVVQAVKTPEETSQILAERNKEPERKVAIPYVSAPAELYAKGRQPTWKSKVDFLAQYNAANRAAGLPDVDFEAYLKAAQGGAQ